LIGAIAGSMLGVTSGRTAGFAGGPGSFGTGWKGLLGLGGESAGGLPQIGQGHAFSLHACGLPAILSRPGGALSLCGRLLLRPPAARGEAAAPAISSSSP